MANMMRCGIRLFTLKHSKQAVPRVLLSSKYQRLCFHTSWVLDVKGKELSMPALSPTMENGTIVKWLKKEGDLVSPGDVIADIQTDKAVMSLETEDEFILAKIIIPEGKNAKIGDLIAVTVEPGEDWKSVEMPDGASNSTSASSASTPSASPPPAAAAAAGPVAEPPPGQTNVSMPSLSPTMESGTIVKWLKKEGDSIEPGDAVAEIQTDKAVMTFEMEDEGILAKILAPEGSQAKVGDLIAIVVEKDFDKSQLVVPGSTKAGAQPAAAAAAPAAAAPAPQATIQPPPSGQNNISMPSLSPTMETGTIVKWLKKEGDSIEPGDGVADIQTDKAVMTFEMEEEGILAKILAPEGTQASIGDLIAIIVEKDFDLSNLVIPATTKAGAPAAASSAASATTAAAPAATTSVGDQPPPSGQVYGLAVRRLLEEYGLSSGSLKGTGRGNRLLKEDVLNYINQKNLSRVAPKPASVAASDSVSQPSTKTAPTSTPTPTWSGGPSTFKDVPVSNIRAVIAKRLGESKSTIPHSFASIDINIDKLTELRSELRVDNIKVSVNDFITKAVGHALVECPSINTLYQNGKIVHKPQVDVSIAVSTPSGLITPIVFNAAQKGLKEIADDIRTLAGKARDNKLQPQEFQGGTFTISNLGMFGIKNFSAIINPPQTAILAVGTGREVLDLSMRKTTLMTVTLSYDSRAIDEFQASDFLTVLQSMLQNPGFLAVNRPQIHRRERN